MELNNSNVKHYSTVLGAVIAATALLTLGTTIICVQQAQAYSTAIVSGKFTFMPWYGEGKVTVLPPVRAGSGTDTILPLTEYNNHMILI